MINRIELGTGLSREWLVGGQILKYMPSEISPKIMKLWSDDVIQQLQNWPVEKRPRLFLFSLMNGGVCIPFLTLTQRDVQNLGLTQDGRSAVERYLQDNPQQIVRLALVLPMSLSGGIVRKYNLEKSQHVETEIFSEQVDAEDWLLSK